jgi:hypothetical protein
VKSNRAADLHLVRELTERQRDQQFIESQRAEYYARANAVSTPDKPIDPEWDGVKL